MKKITLQKREKKMLIALAIVAVLSALQLYSVYGGGSEEENFVVENTPAEATPAEDVSSTEGSGGSYSGSSVKKGGVARKGGGSKKARVLQLSDVEKHNNINDCWVLASGYVLDITSYLSSEPLDSKDISSYCGTSGFEVGYFSELSEEEKKKILRQSTRKGKLK